MTHVRDALLEVQREALAEASDLGELDPDESWRPDLGVDLLVDAQAVLRDLVEDTARALSHLSGVVGAPPPRTRADGTLAELTAEYARLVDRGAELLASGGRRPVPEADHRAEVVAGLVADTTRALGRLVQVRDLGL